MKKDSRSTRARSKILWQVTALVLVIFIISVVIIGLFNYRSTNTIIKESKNRLISTQGKAIRSGYTFSNKLFIEILLSEIPELTGKVSELTTAVMSKTLTPILETANQMSKEYVEQGAMGIELTAVVLPAFPPTIPEPMVIISSNEDLVFTDVPPSVQEIIDSDKGYGFLENGIPEWGLKDEQLVAVTTEGGDLTGGQIEVSSVGVKPVHDEVQSINDFYNEQKRNSSTVLIIVAFVALAVLCLVTFFVLSFLIRTRITRPIDELSDAAEKVLEGDLDVQVPMKQNEEFANLKKAFNEMIKHIREIVTRSTE